MPADPKLVLDESVMRYALAAPPKLRSRLVAHLEQLQRSTRSHLISASRMPPAAG